MKSLVLFHQSIMLMIVLGWCGTNVCGPQPLVRAGAQVRDRWTHLLCSTLRAKYTASIKHTISVKYTTIPNTNSYKYLTLRSCRWYKH